MFLSGVLSTLEVAGPNPARGSLPHETKSLKVFFLHVHRKRKKRSQESKQTGRSLSRPLDSSFDSLLLRKMCENWINATNSKVR